MRYTLLGFLCLATLIAYLQRTAFNGVTELIESDLGIGTDELGYVLGAWYLTYALFQLPSGWVADRLGSKPALMLLIVSWSVLTGLVGLAMGLTGLILMWGLMGAAQAGIFPCCTKAIGATFPRTEQAIASGMLACCMSLGAALAPAVTGTLLKPSWLLGAFTWQEIFAIYAVLGVVWAVLFWLVVPQPATTLAATSSQADGVDDSAPAPVVWWKLFTDFSMQVLCLQQFLRAGAMVFFYTWFARFLKEARGLSADDAAVLAAWPPFAGAFGGLFGGFVSDFLLRRTGNARLARQGLTCALMTICTAVAAAAFFVADPHFAVLLMSVGAFCGVAGGVSAYAVAISYGGKQVATVFATMNMCGNIGSSLFPVAVGLIVMLTGNWNLALLLFASLFAINAICWAFLNPKGTLFDRSEKAEEPL